MHKSDATWITLHIALFTSFPIRFFLTFFIVSFLFPWSPFSSFSNNFLSDRKTPCLYIMLLLLILNHLNYNILSRLHSFKRIDSHDEEFIDSSKEIFPVCSQHYSYKQYQENNIGSTLGNRIPIFSVRALIDD